MKKEFIWLITSCLIVAALVLASCAPAVVEEKKATVVTKEPEKKAEKVEEVVEAKTKYGGMLTMVNATAPMSFDELDAVGATGLFGSFYYDYLIIGDWWADRDICDWTSPYAIQMVEELWKPALAESWERPDNMTVIFYLREGVRWQNKPPVNGREFVADDVVRQVERIVATEKLAAHRCRTTVKSVTATDKYTVVFKLTEPYALIMQYLGPGQYMQITPYEVYDTYGNLRDWKTLVGTGPFILDDYVLDSCLTYSRNPDYFAKDPDGNQLPYVDGVKMLIMLDTATRTAALRTGKVDLITPHCAVAWDQKASLEATNPELEWAVAPWGAGFAVNLKNSVEPFDDIRVRQALSMAINRQEIVDTIFGGNATAFAWPTFQEWGPGVFTPLDELPEDVKELFSYNPTKSKELLAEAGYPNGFDASIQYSATGKWECYGDCLELVQAYWADIGVDITLRPVEAGTMQSLKYKPFPFDHMLGTGGGIIEPVNFTFSRYRTGGTFNRACVSDPYVDEMIDKAGLEFDYTERCRILKELYVYILEQRFDISMPRAISYSAWYPWVKGYQGEAGISFQGGFGTIASHIWLDQDLKK